MVSAKVVWLTGIGAVVGTNIGWFYVLKTQPEFKLSEVSPFYLTVGAIGGAVAGGLIGYAWDKRG